MSALVTESDLDGQPGSPFDPTLIDTAVAQVRARAGWHIAPVVTETVTLTVYGGSPFLFLPTRKLVSVSQVRRNGVAVATDAYTVVASGMLFRSSPRCFGWDFGVYQVDLVHGYATCPPELVGLVAAIIRDGSQTRDPSVSRMAVGSVSLDYRDTETGGWLDDPALSRYTLPAGVA